jgi:flagellin-like protein
MSISAAAKALPNGAAAVFGTLIIFVMIFSLISPKAKTRKTLEEK